MNDTDMGPPSPLLSDYIEMTYLAILVILGIPLNAFILLRLIHELKRTQKDSVKAGFLLLKIHLNVSDILMLCMALGKLIWLATYHWPGGDLACRLYQCLSMGALYVSSNIVVCIAVDRLRNVLYANQLHTGYKKMNPTTAVLTISWLLAGVCALPQLVVFETYEVFTGWYQCTDVWQLHRYFNVWPSEALRPILLSEYAENAYNITHLIIVFWGPLLVLIVSYVFIATKLMHYSSNGKHLDGLRSHTSPQETNSSNGE
ncbi:hypothetical protein ANCDUO_04819 [Ancylostoma duodenale]|uniref:G-protein coupled receptors family 1 profile domain-containing protein n=1 Tax=Ancylostoma duodenale TaxID=51022 RepID=A0A0C2GU64_9BILA|nr:hypothetical protein ANCDUO_04819 [Ancylostoma duodenale]